MNKRLLLRIATCFCFMVSLMFLGQATTFAEEIQYTDNVIPAMTSNTSPSGEASASTVYQDTKYPAYLAFDHISNSISSAWVCAYGSSTGWLAYEFENKKCITKYTLVSRNPVTEITEMPKTWTFEAYNEETDRWIILDKQTNITMWTIGVKKEFVFSNTSNFKKYRINVSANCDSSHSLVIGELEMMETVSPINLVATTRDEQVFLSWDAVTKAESYNVKRSTTAGGPYLIIATNITGTKYTDTNVMSGTTYYYIVTANVNGSEGQSSNEASVTPQATTVPNQPIENKVLLVITMVTGERKEYELSADKINEFITWFNSKAASSPMYVIEKDYNKASFISRKDYIAYKQISNFEVNEYSD